jgi:hypothetical protein
MNVLRSIAVEQFKSVEKRHRVWSDELESWGLYAKDPGEDDAFLIWSLIKLGDRLQWKNSHAVLVSSEREVRDGVIEWKFKFLAPGALVFDTFVEERELFKAARKYI